MLVKYKGPYPAVYLPAANLSVAKGATAAVSGSVAASLLTDPADWEAADAEALGLVPHIPANIQPIIGYAQAYDPLTLYSPEVLVEEAGAVYLSLKQTEGEDPATHSAAWLKVSGTGGGSSFTLPVHAPVEANATLTSGQFTPVNAEAAARTMKLPTGSAAGTLLVAEKSDASVNTVTLEGSIRGVGSATLILRLQHETVLFVADSAGSWWPLASHKTLGSLDERFQHQVKTLAEVASGLKPAVNTETWVYGTLSADTTVTVTPSAGVLVRFLLLQDATGGHTFSISDGTTTVVVPVSTQATAPSVVSIYSPNGTDFYVS